MSEVNSAPVWYPPSFPEQGRLPSVASLTGKNCHQQNSRERAYHKELCLAANRRVAPPCCKTLHISLFFDGTGNNLNHDLNIADPKHPTNIARLFRATVGQGYAAGLGNKNSALTDLPDTAGNKYFKYYIPGVGTPFPEIMDLDFTMGGLAFASHGEDRINWGLLRIIDALRRTTGLGKMDDGECWASVQAMSTTMMSFGLTGGGNRYNEFQRLLKSPPLHSRLKMALNPGEPGKIKLLGIKLYIYGFSRGAAAARAFVNWLSELLPAPKEGQDKPEQCLMAGDLKIPLSVEFLGLFDTVASVGVPHIAPVAEGHMGWADGNQALPEEKRYGGLIKHGVHLVSAHEQRLCFPLDSIRRTDGSYPARCVEVLYPGMHSDLGGGYPPGDQGKANRPDDALLLSQIALHDMYAAAFAAGAPFKIPLEAIPDALKKDQWRALPPDVQDEFIIHPQLIRRFNAWRTLTLNLSSSEEDTSPEQASQLTPMQAPMSLEKAMETQIAWLTTWRIGRYATGTYKTQRFYLDAAAGGLDADSDPEVRKAHEQERTDKQKAVEDDRKNELIKAPKNSFILLPQGPKDFDAMLGQTQLRQGAEEFREDYRELQRDSTQEWYYEPLYALKNTLYLLNTDDEYAEWMRMKTAGESRLKVLFPDTGEAGNTDRPASLVRALFDDQIHDSRAWFMHNAFGSREPWGGYFRYRMVYFGNNCNKSLSPLIVAGWVVGAATLAGGVALAIRQKSVQGKILGVAGAFGAISLEVEAIDILSGKPIPMLPGSELLRAFTQQPGVAVAQQKAAMAEQYLAQHKATINAIWLELAQETIN
ncbi:T6SS phospholipase effector Tle1-like catalytic domain-containing protein [Klebsiella sp. 141161]|uniref:T6SS phospholipase effector Tle1-like catalytic domain-containing protein n=1 Tax=Klebsiella sp. 141161 TaxID=3020037 RepID=UPI003D329734